MKSLFSKFGVILWLVLCILACSSPDGSNKDSQYSIKKISSSVFDLGSCKQMPTDKNCFKSAIKKDNIALTLNCDFDEMIATEMLFIEDVKASTSKYSMDSITDVRIISLCNYDSNHPEGADITPLFYYYEKDKKGMTILPVISNQDKIPLTEFPQFFSTKSKKERYSTMVFHPFTKPNADSMKLKIIIRFSEGRELISITPGIKLLD